MKPDPQIVLCSMLMFGALGSIVGWAVGVWPISTGFRMAAIFVGLIAVAGTALIIALLPEWR